MGLFEDLFEKARSFFTETGKVSQLEKKCFYELLEVRRDATDDEIKRAYKKLALKWHPDKNLEHKAECTAYFVLLQQAYGTLSNPQERAFYDKHRENIIRGSTTLEEMDDGVDLEPFTRRFFTSYDNTDDGFFNVYRQLFDKLASEEFPYIDDEDDKNFPSFGDSTSDYDQIVKPFYDYWCSFSTLRSFAWLDKYNVRQANDRHILKEMVKENKKLREAGKKQRNDKVREVAQYIRRHDPRVKQHRKDLKTLKKSQLDQVVQNRQTRMEKNLRIIENQDTPSDLKEDDYLDMLDGIETELDEQLGLFRINEDGGTDPDFYYCVVCDKKMRTSKAYSSHQKSSKHRKAMDELRIQMAEDNEEARSETNEDVDEVPNEADEASNEAEEAPNEVGQSSSKPAKSAKQGNMSKKNSTKKAADQDEASDLDDDFVEEPTSKCKKAKGKRNKNANESLETATTSNGKTAIQSSCLICSRSFPSRSKLFDHIKATGHAAIKDTKGSSKKKR